MTKAVDMGRWEKVSHMNELKRGDLIRLDSEPDGDNYYTVTSCLGRAVVAVQTIYVDLPDNFKVLRRN